jgi:metal-responsive CopG/Arc/MetJ family transcriptional regulator
MNRQRGERLQIMLSPEELEALDDFRFKQRMPSRASAIRELLRRGLGVIGGNKARQGRRSDEFGVLTDASSAPGNGGSSGQ